MLCRWADKQIVVLDSVIINEPYGLNNVKGNDQNAVQRVKKVVSCPFSLPNSLLTPAARGRETEAGDYTAGRHSR